MTPGRSPDLLLPARFEHPEGLVWDQRNDRLLWVDVFAAEVLSLKPSSGELTRYDVGQPVGCVAPTHGAELVCGVRDGFGTLSGAGAFELRLPTLAHEPALQMNDGAVDPAGRLWAGTLSLDPTARGGLFRLDPDWSATLVLDDVTVSNGIGWSPDASSCYYIDTVLNRIDVFDFDLADGVLSNRRVFADVDHSPDGLAVDAEGGVWVALFDGGQVRRFAPTGTLDRSVQLPGRYVTTCAFGGADLRTLFIAVSRREVDDATAAATRAGHIFAVDVGVAGLPGAEFHADVDAEGRR